MERKKVAIQGIAGSFHEEAAYKHFGENIEILECSTFRALCEALKTEQVDYAMMAIENTIAGSLLSNYKLLTDYHLKILGEVFLHIQMNLMVVPGVKLSDIQFVHSHPIALRQCGDYLEALPNVTLVEKNDTAESAKLVKEQNLLNTAAVASVRAAEMYGLEILEKRIETNKKNYTRFLVVSKQPKNGFIPNKASICFEVGHYVGALAQVLTILSENKINLTKIQSIPILGKPYEYSFHIDLEWDNSDEYERAIHKILRCVSNLSILGEYRKGEFPQQTQAD